MNSIITSVILPASARSVPSASREAICPRCACRHARSIHLAWLGVKASSTGMSMKLGP